jgi:tetratricopeptide (TPR) repeat protein
MSYIRKRKSKKSGIIPQEIIADERSLSQWVHENAKKLIYGGGTILLILAISFGYVWVKARNARLAGEDLSSALRFYWSVMASIPTDDPGSDTVQLEQALANFTDVAGKHGKAVQGLTASLYRAGLLYHLGRYQETAQVLEELQSENPATFSDLNASLLLASSYEAQGDFEKAIGVYSSMRDHAVGDLKALLTVDIARCSELTGNIERTIALYRELETGFPGTIFAARAEKKLAILGAIDREEP